MFETPKTESITAQRKAYVQSLMETAARKVAADLKAGDTTREIAIHALGQLWAGYLPHSGLQRVRSLGSPGWEGRALWRSPRAGRLQRGRGLGRPGWSPPRPTG